MTDEITASQYDKILKHLDKYGTSIFDCSCNPRSIEISGNIGVIKHISMVFDIENKRSKFIDTDTGYPAVIMHCKECFKVYFLASMPLLGVKNDTN